MKVFIQKVPAKDEWEFEFPSINFFQADQGFRELGYEIEYFVYLPDQEGNAPFRFADTLRSDVPVFTKDTIVVGGVQTVDAVYDLLKVNNPHLESYPHQLDEYMCRKISEKTLEQVRTEILDDIENDRINPQFIKPKAEQRKVFTGHVVSRYVDLIKTAGLPGETKVWSSPIVEFISEYRVFINRGKIVGLKHYKGDFLVFPDDIAIERMVNDYYDAPIAYSLDVGVTKSPFDASDTLLVEVNDANALGCYGLGPVTYANMIVDRWNEVVNNDRS